MILLNCFNNFVIQLSIHCFSFLILFGKVHNSTIILIIPLHFIIKILKCNSYFIYCKYLHIAEISQIYFIMQDIPKGFSTDNLINKKVKIHILLKHPVYIC